MFPGAMSDCRVIGLRLHLARFKTKDICLPGIGHERAKGGITDLVSWGTLDIRRTCQRGANADLIDALFLPKWRGRGRSLENQ